MLQPFYIMKQHAAMKKEEVELLSIDKLLGEEKGKCYTLYIVLVNFAK